jgi:hypothetical protein
MRWMHIVFAALAACLFIAPPAPAAGDRDRSYLGLTPSSKSFALNQMRAEFFFGEFYHQLCYGCLREAASYNAFSRNVAANPFLCKRLKMLGPGMAILLREVLNSSRRNSVMFPLFANQDQDLLRCLGEPDLPFAYVLEHDAKGRLKIMRILPGHIGDAGKVFSERKTAAANAAYLKAGPNGLEAR